jgi:hypothetical protein
LEPALSPRSSSNDYERNNHITVQRLQEPELYDDEEPEEASGPVGDVEVLQYLQETYGA